MIENYQCSVQPKTVYFRKIVFLQTTERFFCLLDLVPAFYLIFFLQMSTLSLSTYLRKLSVYFTITKELSYKD